MINFETNLKGLNEISVTFMGDKIVSIHISDKDMLKLYRQLKEHCEGL